MGVTGACSEWARRRAPAARPCRSADWSTSLVNASRHADSCIRRRRSQIISSCRERSVIVYNNHDDRRSLRIGKLGTIMIVTNYEH